MLNLKANSFIQMNNYVNCIIIDRRAVPYFSIAVCINHYKQHIIKVITDCGGSF